MWEVSADELGPCPEPECGQAETTLTRVVLCMEGGAVVDEADCQADKPAASLVCPATDACVVFSWHADDFAACRTACGTPAETLTRSVRCVGDDDSTGDESSCTGAKPAEALDCDAAAPCTYAWEVVESLCPSECGVAASTVERDVACQDSDGETADSASCTDDKPSTEQDCPATPACVTYEWSASDFEPCPTECGLAASSLTREVICLGSDGSTGADSNCTSLDSRPSTKDCPVTTNCVWHASEFEACPTECGLAASTLERVVECVDPADTSLVVEHARCAEDEKPTTALDCTATAACITYAWMGLDFDACPSECGLQESRLTRVLTCVGSDGIPAASDKCTDAPPATEQDCPATPACVTYEWSASDFEPCPTECGLAASSLTREVICLGSDGSTGADSNCTSLDSRPSTKDCPVTTNCVWHASEFEACPTECGLAASTLERVVECVDPADTSLVVEHARCNFEDKLDEAVVCEATARCIVYEWDEPAFDDCADGCGLPPSTIARTVICKGDDGSVAASASSCALPKPAETQACDATRDCSAAEMLEILQTSADCPIGELVFNYDIEMFPPDSARRTDFERSFKAEIASFLGISTARVQVLQVKAGSMIVVFTIQHPRSSEVAETSVSSVEAMQTLSRALEGHYDEGSPRLLDEAKFETLSVLRLEAGLRTDLVCELATDGVGLDCDPTDELSALKDDLDDFAAAPVAFVKDPAHITVLALAGSGALAVLALLFCFCRRCCCKKRAAAADASSTGSVKHSQPQEFSRLDEGSSSDDGDAQGMQMASGAANQRAPGRDHAYDIEGGGSGGGGGGGGAAARADVDVPTSAENTSSDFDDDEDDIDDDDVLAEGHRYGSAEIDDDNEGDAMLRLRDQMGSDESARGAGGAENYRAAVFRGSS